MSSKINSKGFTLIEMVSTVVIIGVLAALAVPLFSKTMEKLKLNAATRDVVSDIRWARSKAIASRTQVGINFNLSSKTYTVFMDTDNPSLFEYSAADDSILKTYNFSGLGTMSTTFADSTVIFKPDGSATTSGQFSCQSYGGTHTRTVDVLASTGRVKVS